MVEECLKGGFSDRFQLEEIFALEEWIMRHAKLLNSSGCRMTAVSPTELERISSLKTPNQAAALMAVTGDEAAIHPEKKHFYLGLDRIQDPGNVGTIFRIAEWFGIRAILLSEGCAHPLHPKVIQAAMGSVLRVPFQFTNLAASISQLPVDYPVIGTLLHGKPLSETSKPTEGIILIGNESQGLNTEILKRVNLPVTIESYSNNPGYPESLNAAIATAVVLHDFRNQRS